MAATLDTSVGAGQLLDLGELVPQAVSAVETEGELLLETRLHELHVVVEHWDGDHGGQDGDRRDGDAEESKAPKVLRLPGELLHGAVIVRKRHTFSNRSETLR